MLAIFVILTGAILTVGPGHIEGGFDAIRDHGAKAAFENAWDERAAYDSGSLKNSKTGNFGND